jgi:hypothetical protein
MTHLDPMKNETAESLKEEYSVADIQLNLELQLVSVLKLNPEYPAAQYGREDLNAV